MLLVAQVSLTALNPLLSFETHVAAPTASFLTRDYDGDKKNLVLFVFAKMFVVIWEGEEKNQEKSTY